LQNRLNSKQQDGSLTAACNTLAFLLQANLDRIMETLPDASKAANMITIAYALSQYYTDEVSLH